MPHCGAYRPFLWVPSGLEPQEIPSWKVALEFHLATQVIRSLKNSVRHALYEHPEPLWQRVWELLTDALFLFLNLQLIRGLLSSTGNLDQTYEKLIGYYVLC